MADDTELARTEIYSLIGTTLDTDGTLLLGTGWQNKLTDDSMKRQVD